MPQEITFFSLSFRSMVASARLLGKDSSTGIVPGRAFTKSSIITRAQQVDPRLGRNAFLSAAHSDRVLRVGHQTRPLDRRARLRCYRAVAGWLGDRIAARARGSQHLGPRNRSSQVS